MTDLRSFLMVFCLALAACGQGGQDNSSNASAPPAKETRANRAQTVSITHSRTESFPQVMTTQGNVIALDEVDLHAQKTGIISQIHFTEGEEVRKGQLLFSLDARDEEANLRKAEARVTGSRTQLEITRRDWQRAQDLASKNFISAAGLDTTRAKLDTAESTLAQDIAALESAKVQLSYDFIRAPFSGRAGRIDVRVGSLVQANATTSLVKITRLDPIGVSFTLPERFLPLINAAGDKVQILADNGSTGSVRGRITFIENSIDRTAGTISIKAQFANSQHQLWPGQFVSVEVQAGEIKNAVTLPAQAIQNNSNGPFVYIVNNDSTVSAQPIQVEQIHQERAVITGIGSDIKVVFEGGQNLRPGGKITEVASRPANGKRNRRGSEASAANR